LQYNKLCHLCRTGYARFRLAQHPREGYSPPQPSMIDKKVRVVVTLTYYLER